MRNTFLSFVAAMSVAMIAGHAQAKPALKDVAHVREGIIATGMAYEISQQCGSIRARLLRGYNYLNSIKDHARGLGYSEAEIDAYTNDKAEEARLVSIARAQLADKGAVPGQAETYCAVGRAEIAAGSPIGRLLR